VAFFDSNVQTSREIEMLYEAGNSLFGRAGAPGGQFETFDPQIIGDAAGSPNQRRGVRMTYDAGS
jgi:hypothetical protein